MDMEFGPDRKPQTFENGIKEVSDLPTALGYLERKYELGPRHLEGEPIEGDLGIIYACQSPHHLILSDGIGFSCEGRTYWQMQEASFCLSFDTQTLQIDGFWIRPELLEG